ncbi:hypothetical protein [uncultured Alistipes sp.]|uniref:endonuclease/exonuclease/phosphatase family protein n=1 Tax=uncultured Alistipes sp. TaxID=538949 RepID=UPI0032096E8F
MSRSLSILAILVLASLAAAAKSPVGIVFYDVDRIYDTIPALFYDDSDYTPEGRYGWNSERYTRKIRNTAAVIDSMALDIVALWGVENEQVVRDLSAACREAYTYLHRTLNTLDGMDFALLFFADRFAPERVETGRRYLYVEGECEGRTLGLVLCGDARTTEWLVADLREEHPGVPLVVMGRVGRIPAERFGLRDATARVEKAGRGNIRRAGRWEMRDRMLVDTLLDSSDADVFARRYLVDQKSGNPLRTYSRGVYRGGYGYSLPVFVYIR